MGIRGLAPLGRELPSWKGASRWEETFPVGRDLPGGKRPFRWEESFQLLGGKEALSSLVGKELPGGKEASR